MKDKLEVGHFIRTIKGIGRIEEITEDKTEIYFNCDTGLTISFIKKDFTQEEMAQYYKHSDNIIDLIEEGDYVNGVEVIGKEFDNFNKEYLQCGVSDYVICTFEVKDIKTILTKEQYENNCYKVEE